MNVVICDDSEKDLSQLRFYVERYFKEVNCHIDILTYKSGDDLLSDLAAGKLSDTIIAFLDIFMPGIDGIDTAKKIREANSDMVIIFTTISMDHMLDGYSVYAMQYLVKPVKYPEIKDVLGKCMTKYADALRSIEVLSDRLTVKVYLKDIIYLEFSSKALYIHTTTETLKTFLPLSELEKQLENSSFLRTHRSYLVNMRYIKQIQLYDFLLTNNEKIPIRRNDKLTVKQAYRDYLSSLTCDNVSLKN